jgi:hypothetical protein
MASRYGVVIAVIADLEREARAAAIDRVIALLDRPALGAFEPWRSRRREAARAELEHDVYDLLAARAWTTSEGAA